MIIKAIGMITSGMPCVINRNMSSFSKTLPGLSSNYSINLIKISVLNDLKQINQKS